MARRKRTQQATQFSDDHFRELSADGTEQRERGFDAQRASDAAERPAKEEAQMTGPPAKPKRARRAA